MAVGDIIKRLRLSHKLSQSELGKIAGVTDKAVSTWEKNVRQIKNPPAGVLAGGTGKE